MKAFSVFLLGCVSLLNAVVCVWLFLCRIDPLWICISDGGGEESDRARSASAAYWHPILSSWTIFHAEVVSLVRFRSNQTMKRTDSASNAPVAFELSPASSVAYLGRSAE